MFIKNWRLIPLNRLSVQEALSRASLAEQTGLTRSTISRIVDELIKEKLVHEIASTKNERGRPSVLLLLNPEGGSAIGLEISVHFISILLTNFLSTPLWRERIALPNEFDWQIYAEKAEGLIREASAIAQKRKLPLMGIGAAVWGLVNDHNQMIHYAPNLK